MGKDKKPTIQKPSKPAKPTKPAKPAKPKAETPAKQPADVMPAAVSAAFDKYEGEFFASTTPRTKDTKTVLKSPHGYFRVYEYDNQGNPKDKHVAVFFSNKRTGAIQEVHGTIARKYLELIPNRDNVVDFPITDELVARADASDRISGLSLYALHWNHSTNVVTQRPYKSFEPDKGDVLISCTQEFATGLKDVNFKNWKGEKRDKYNKKSRGLRPTGMPTQVQLHETAGQGNMSITGASQDEKDKDLYYVPQFCVNNIDSSRKGNIIQFVDLAERTSQGPPLNDRSVGIEFVNAPIEAKNKSGELIFKHASSKKGVYLKTVLTSYPQLFIPLEFYPPDDESSFSLTIPEEDLVNKKALADLEVASGSVKQKVTSKKDGIVTIANCRSDKFEHMVSLVRLLQSSGQVTGLDLTRKEQHRSIVTREGKDLFLFQHGWIKEKGGIRRLCVDSRLAGVFNHGLTGDHNDGFLQALYLFLRVFKGFTPQAALQRLIDSLAKSKSAKAPKRPAITLPELVTISSTGEETPKSPKDIKIENYLDVT